MNLQNSVRGQPEYEQFQVVLAVNEGVKTLSIYIYSLWWVLYADSSATPSEEQRFCEQTNSLFYKLVLSSVGINVHPMPMPCISTRWFIMWPYKKKLRGNQKKTWIHLILLVVPICLYFLSVYLKKICWNDINQYEWINLWYWILNNIE